MNMLKENDKTFKFQRYVSTDSLVIFSWLIYKALEVEFMMSRKMLIVDSKRVVLFEYE